MHSTGMILLVETRIQGKKVGEVLKKICLDGYLKVESIGFLSDLWLL